MICILPGGSSTAEFNISGQKSNCMHGGAGANGGRGGTFQIPANLKEFSPEEEAQEATHIIITV